MDLSANHRRILLDVARQTIRTILRGGAADAESPPAADLVDPALSQPAGCFVTLHALRTHRLRGCVGRLDARESLVLAVRQAAESVLEDPRFTDNPVAFAELPELELEITVLSPLQPASDPLDFDLENEGIYLVIDGRAGCFLPQVARETGWTRQQLLSRLCTEKLGLPCDAWQDPSTRLMKFQALIVGPEPFDRETG